MPELKEFLQDQKPNLKPKAHKEWDKMSSAMCYFYGENLLVKATKTKSPEKEA